MPLAQGTRLGLYELSSLIGAGAMGEVYRARDTKLRREVAVKVLPDSFARDPERLARFQREARFLASLNHSGIATLHGLESEGGTHFLVMELVPGETLADRLARGPLAFAEALPLFRQIAEALEAAHAGGVVHRDFKPANIKVTPDGKIKILDFGLAKGLVEETAASDRSQSPTLVRDATEAGVVLGTACYMSPEQARGKTVDKRTDIWAFGCVLYEALTGKKAFDGESVADILGAIVHQEPSWEALPPETPRRARDVLERCLRKDPHERLHDIADARIELGESGPAEPQPNRGATPATPRPLCSRRSRRDRNRRRDHRRDYRPDRSPAGGAARASGLSACDSAPCRRAVRREQHPGALARALARRHADRLCNSPYPSRQSVPPAPARRDRDPLDSRHRARLLAVLLAGRRVARILRRGRSGPQEGLGARRPGGHAPARIPQCRLDVRHLVRRWPHRLRYLERRAARGRRRWRRSADL